MSALKRIVLSWAATIIAIVLAVRDFLTPGVFGDPTVIAPLALAYVFRHEIRPPIPRLRRPSRRWLIVPVLLFAFYMLLPIDALLAAMLFCTVVWMVRDDISIYRHHSHGRTTA